jgi:hypothetical protein
MEITLLINKEDKYKYTNDTLLINSDNVYLTYANVVRLNGNIYGVYGDDGSLIVEYDKLCNAIKNGDDVIINLNYKNYIVAAIIPKSLETKLTNAIADENYELARIIKTKIDKRNENNDNENTI